ncbi:hypothetical protein B0H66DRAFT_533325 [Apodospora peruviana]|uniref:Uncharacterized protein n=1 Tax=Apodospora peruviana TaxID=516989 RepID=A0AAE0M5N8_9PEZI|nr:hypothetical protein B0H66DRAFT_533325 [Apodospora peruviana]
MPWTNASPTSCTASVIAGSNPSNTQTKSPLFVSGGTIAINPLLVKQNARPVQHIVRLLFHSNTRFTASLTSPRRLDLLDRQHIVSLVHQVPAAALYRAEACIFAKCWRRVSIDDRLVQSGTHEARRTGGRDVCQKSPNVDRMSMLDLYHTIKMCSELYPSVSQAATVSACNWQSPKTAEVTTTGLHDLRRVKPGSSRDAPKSAAPQIAVIPDDNILFGVVDAEVKDDGEEEEEEAYKPMASGMDTMHSAPRVPPFLSLLKVGTEDAALKRHPTQTPRLSARSPNSEVGLLTTSVCKRYASFLASSTDDLLRPFFQCRYSSDITE